MIFNSHKFSHPFCVKWFYWYYLYFTKEGGIIYKKNQTNQVKWVVAFVKRLIILRRGKDL